MHRIAALALTGAVVLGARPGALDPTFGVRGKITTRIGHGAGAYAIAVQPDGKLVVAGWSKVGSGNRFALARYTVHGLLDRSFGSRGTVTTAFGPDSFALALALQRDGKIVAAGYTTTASHNRFALARYDRSGKLDRSFGVGGKVATAFAPAVSGRAVEVQPDGKILVAGGGRGSFVLARYRRGGSLDRAFGVGGRVLTKMSPDDGGFAAVEALALQPDGKILATGTDGGHEWSEMAIARYAPNGSLDWTFGVAGAVHLLDAALSENDAAAVRIQRDGRIVLGGSFVARFALIRLMPDGSVDRGFGADGPGRTFTPFGYGAGATALAVQRDGKFVLAGASQNGKHQIFALARYDRRGRLDPAFGTVTTSFSRGEDLAEGVAWQRNGKIVAAGIADEGGPSGGRFAVVRYLGAARGTR